MWQSSNPPSVSGPQPWSQWESYTCLNCEWKTILISLVMPSTTLIWTRRSVSSDSKHHPKTASWTTWEKWQRAMPFGIWKTPAKSWLITHDLGIYSIFYKCLQGHLVIWSDSREVLLSHTGTVIQWLHQHGFTVKHRKCEGGSMKIEFLGPIARESQLSVQECWVLEIWDYKR